MRSVFLLVLLVSFSARAQINRSATELACEKIRDYVTTKVFHDSSYTMVSVGKLEAFPEYDRNIKWVLQQQFTMQPGKEKGKSEARPYLFVFYLDKKMNVFRAESVQ